MSNEGQLIALSIIFLGIFGIAMGIIQWVFHNLVNGQHFLN